MADLTTKKCRPIEKGTPPLGSAQVSDLLKQVPGWSFAGDHLEKTFNFKNYYETMAFVNATAWISHREDHHPDIEVGYNKCKMRYNTHTVGGVSENDFICAAKVEKLLTM